MDQYYIVRLGFLKIMLTTIFRLGPFAILEFALVVAILAIGVFMDLPSCTYYTLGYLAIIVFLVEMIASMRMMKSNPALRRHYLYERVTESHLRYCLRSVWDNFNIIVVIMLLYYSHVVDGIALNQTSQDGRNGVGSYGQQTCQYTLFALCLFTEIEDTLNSDGYEDMMVMWLLFVASGFITTIVCVCFSIQYYHYCSSMVSNRKLHKELGTINQTLMDCQIYSIKSEVVVNESVRDSVGICSICLNQNLELGVMSEDKVVKLRCNHIFHKECLDLWLKVKDHCPFRCYT